MYSIPNPIPNSVIARDSSEIWSDLITVMSKTVQFRVINQKMNHDGVKMSPYLEAWLI